MKIMLDPGHAGRTVDPGAVHAKSGLQEADVVLVVARLVKKYLVAVGHEVQMTRSTWEDVKTDELSYRTSVSNEWGADVFVSLHCNSAENKEAKGFEVWTSPGNTQGDRLASYIYEEIHKEFSDRRGRTDYSDGDADKESRFYVLVYTDAPACLIEMAFISNADEAALLGNLTWQERYAKAIARGITDYAAALSKGL